MHACLRTNIVIISQIWSGWGELGIPAAAGGGSGELDERHAVLGCCSGLDSGLLLEVEFSVVLLAALSVLLFPEALTMGFVLEKFLLDGFQSEVQRGVCLLCP